MHAAVPFNKPVDPNVPGIPVSFGIFKMCFLYGPLGWVHLIVCVINLTSLFIFSRVLV